MRDGLGLCGPAAYFLRCLRVQLPTPSMRHRLPPLNTLRVFEAIYRRGSIRQAADELCLTPQAVSQSPEYMRLFGGAAGRGLAVYSHDHDHTHLPDGRVQHADGSVTDHCHPHDGHHHAYEDDCGCGHDHDDGHHHAGHAAHSPGAKHV